jgi:hypothetical protein
VAADGTLNFGSVDVGADLVGEVQIDFCCGVAGEHDSVVLKGKDVTVAVKSDKIYV